MCNCKCIEVGREQGDAACDDTGVGATAGAAGDAAYLGEAAARSPLHSSFQEAVGRLD